LKALLEKCLNLTIGLKKHKSPGIVLEFGENISIVLEFWECDHVLAGWLLGGNQALHLQALQEPLNT